VRCQTPCRPRRLSTDSASKRMTPGRGHNSAAVIVEYSTTRGDEVAKPETAARRAASAHRQSVYISVRTSGCASARTISTEAPARRIAPAGASSACRNPAVEPSETYSTSTSTGLSARCADRRDLAPEAGRTDELDRVVRRRALDEERHAVALL